MSDNDTNDSGGIYISFHGPKYVGYYRLGDAGHATHFPLTKKPRAIHRLFMR